MFVLRFCSACRLFLEVSADCMVFLKVLAFNFGIGVVFGAVGAFGACVNTNGGGFNSDGPRETFGSGQYLF